MKHLKMMLKLIGLTVVLVVELVDVTESPGLVQDGWLQAVHVVDRVVVGACAIQKGALELLVQVGDPSTGLALSIVTTSNSVNLLLKLFQSWNTNREKGVD